MFSGYEIIVLIGIVLAAIWAATFSVDWWAKDKTYQPGSSENSLDHRGCLFDSWVGNLL